MASLKAFTGDKAFTGAKDFTGKKKSAKGCLLYTCWSILSYF